MSMANSNAIAWLDHTPPIPALIGLFLACYFLGKPLVTAITCPLRSVPGPWYTIFTHYVMKWHTLAGTRMYYVHGLHAAYGPVVRVGPFEVSVGSGEAAAAVHRVGSGFTKAAWYGSVLDTQSPESIGVFSMADPKRHAARRRLFARPFSYNSLLENWEPAVRERVQLAIRRIGDEARSGGEGADLLMWFTLMASDVVTQLSFGEHFGALEQGKQTDFITALQNSLLRGAIQSEFPLFGLIAPYVPVKAIKELWGGRQLLFEGGEKAYQNMKINSGNSRNLFSQILAQADSSEEAGVSELMVRYEAVNLTIGGSDTTAVTLTYLVWAVLKRPDLHAALEAEVAALSPTLTQEELAGPGAKLLNSVIEEALRMYGAAPGALPRNPPPGGVTFHGIYIPSRGSLSSEPVVVSTQAYTLHRDPKLFQNPNEFNGRRSIEQPATREQKQALMPFGAGTRICLGIHLAYMELRLGAAMFFRECRGLKLAPSMTDDLMEMSEHLIITPQGHRCNVVSPSSPRA